MDPREPIVTAYTSQEYTQCLSLLEAAPAEITSLTEMRILQASCLVNINGRTSEAHQILDKILESEPANALAFYGKGLAFLRESNLEKSFKNFNKAAELDATGVISKAQIMKLKTEKMLKSKKRKSNRLSGKKNKENSIICEVCNKTFAQPFSLNRHKLIHSGERPHKCTKCSFGFVQKSDLQRHMVVHDDTANFDCNSCEKKFKSKKNLSMHMLTHSTEKEFKCEICGKDFKYRRLMKLHQIIHSKRKKYNCDFCEKIFVTKPSLKAHLMMHINRKNKEGIKLNGEGGIVVELEENKEKKVGKSRKLKKNAEPNSAEVVSELYNQETSSTFGDNLELNLQKRSENSEKNFKNSANTGKNLEDSQKNLVKINENSDFSPRSILKTDGNFVPNVQISAKNSEYLELNSENLLKINERLDLSPHSMLKTGVTLLQNPQNLAKTGENLQLNTENLEPNPENLLKFNENLKLSPENFTSANLGKNPKKSAKTVKNSDLTPQDSTKTAKNSEKSQQNPVPRNSIRLQNRNTTETKRNLIKTNPNSIQIRRESINNSSNIQQKLAKVQQNVNQKGSSRKQQVSSRTSENLSNFQENLLSTSEHLNQDSVFQDTDSRFPNSNNSEQLSRFSLGNIELPPSLQIRPILGTNVLESRKAKNLAATSVRLGSENCPVVPQNIIQPTTFINKKSPNSSIINPLNAFMSTPQAQSEQIDSQISSIFLNPQISVAVSRPNCSENFQRASVIKWSPTSNPTVSSTNNEDELRQKIKLEPVEVKSCDQTTKMDYENSSTHDSVLSSENENQNEWNLFFKSLMHDLTKMDERQKRKFKQNTFMLIDDILK